VYDDAIFERRIKRILALIMEDSRAVFTRAGIQLADMPLTPNAILEFYSSVAKLLLVNNYSAFWTSQANVEFALSPGKIRALNSVITAPHFVVSMMMPLLQPIQLGKTIVVPTPKCFNVPELSYMTDVTTFGDQLGPYYPIGVMQGMRFRRGTVSYFKDQVVGPKIFIGQMSEFVPQVTIWPVAFKRYLHKIISVPSKEDPDKLIPVKVSNPPTLQDQPWPQIHAASTIVRTPYAEWNTQHDRIRTLFFDLEDADVHGDVYHWWLPNPIYNLGYDSFSYKLSMLSCIILKTDIDYSNPSKGRVNFMPSDGDFSSHWQPLRGQWNFSRYGNNESIYDRKFEYGGVTPCNANFSEYYIDLLFRMATSWQDTSFPALSEEGTITVPSPLPDLHVIHSGGFKPSVQRSTNYIAPKAVQDTNVNMHQPKTEVAKEAPSLDPAQPQKQSKKKGKNKGKPPDPDPNVTPNSPA